MSGRFIISTGRSGSTLLSRMVAENRKVLVLSEFMATIDHATRFTPEEIGGAEFARVLTADDDLSALIGLHGRQSPEILNHGSGHAGTTTGRTPGLVRVCLPTLTDDPEGLFEEIIAFVSRLPVRPIADHYHSLFEWLCERLGKRCWLERSGLTIRVFSGLRARFPNARHLHLHRDGPEAALSMHAHPWFRVGVWFDRHPPAAADALRAIRSPVDDMTDIVARLYRDPPPPAVYGRHWSNYMALAYRELTQVPPENYTEMRYEDVLADCAASLEQLAQFFDLPDDPGWIERACALVDGDLRPRAPDLPADVLAALNEACLPGQILTGRAAAGHLDDVMMTLRSAWCEVRGIEAEGDKT